MRTMALRTSERPRRRDLSQPHNRGNEDGGLENVGKAEATSEDDGFENVGKAEVTRSESASQRWPLERHKG